MMKKILEKHFNQYKFVQQHYASQELRELVYDTFMPLSNWLKASSELDINS